MIPAAPSLALPAAEADPGSGGAIVVGLQETQIQ